MDVDLDTGIETIAEDTDGDKDDRAADIMMVMMFRVLILEVGNRKVNLSSPLGSWQNQESALHGSESGHCAKEIRFAS